MSKTRRKSPENKQENVSSLLGSLNIGDILSILSALDLSKLSTSNGSGASGSKKNNQNRTEEIKDAAELNETGTTANDSSADSQRNEIVKAINTLVNADRNLLIQVVVEVFGLNKLANNKK